MPPRASGSGKESSPTETYMPIDPVFQNATLNSVVRATDSSDINEEANRLSAFAQHVLTDGSDRNGDNGHILTYAEDTDGALFTQPPAQEFTELLDADRQAHERNTGDVEGDGHELSEEQRREMEKIDRMGGEEANGREFAEGQEEQRMADGTTGDGGNYGAHGEMGGPPPPPPERMRRVKRKRDEEPVTVVTLETGEVVDVSRQKKDSHKEVERRRRENINDGINEIAKHVPEGAEKMGKGAFLRKAAEHLGKLSAEVSSKDAELSSQGERLKELRDQNYRLQASLEEEQVRSMRYETSWREAEDRAAASQFELARAKNELEELKKNFEAEAT